VHGGREAASFAVRDSAGIAIAESRGIEPGAATPALSDTVGRALDLGELLYVQRMLPIGETALLLGGGSAGALQRIDLSSGQVEVLGRSGQGPGEYGGVAALYHCGADTLIVQSYPSRVSWLDSSGRLLGIYSTPRSVYIHAISREQVFGIRTDSLDLEHVTVLPLAPALRAPPSRGAIGGVWLRPSRSSPPCYPEMS